MERAPIDGIELEYEARGTGEPIVLIHAGVCADFFAPLLRESALTGEFTLVWYHRTGYGGSGRLQGTVSLARQAAHCGALMRHLGIERAHIVGHSSSASIALQLALDAPGTVQSLALLDPARPAAPSAAHMEMVKTVVEPALQRFRAGDKHGAIDAWMRGTCGAHYRAPLERALPGALDQAVADADTFFGQELPAVMQWTFGREDATRIHQPALAVVGQHSSAVFRERRELLLAWLSNVEPFELPDATHLLQVQNPGAMASALASFFSRHPLQASPTPPASAGRISSTHVDRGVEIVGVNGLEIAYARVGEGPPLVFVHGAAEDGRVWQPQLAALADEFTVVAWDEPGAGRSSDLPSDFRLVDYAGCLAALIDRLDLGPAHVAGLSWGSTVVLELYRHYPGLVETLILAGAYAGWEGSLPEEEVRVRVEGVRQMLAATPEEFDPTLPGLFADGPPAEFAALLEDIAADVRPESLRTQVAVISEADQRDLLPRIAVPTLLIWGEFDARSRLTVARQFEQAIPDTTLVVIPEAGHVSHLERPEQFNRALRGFCRAHSPNDPAPPPGPRTPAGARATVGRDPLTDNPNAHALARADDPRCCRQPDDESAWLRGREAITPIWSSGLRGSRGLKYTFEARAAPIKIPLRGARDHRLEKAH